MPKASAASPASRRQPRRPAADRGRVVGALEPMFDRAVMGRGAAYFRNDAVEITEATDRFVVARVRGTRRYMAGIRCDDGAALLWCDCPYVENYQAPCKHLWALVQAADASGALGALRSEKLEAAYLASCAGELEDADRPGSEGLGFGDDDELDDRDDIGANAHGAGAVCSGAAELLCALRPAVVRRTDRLEMELWIRYAGGALERLTSRRLHRAELGDADRWLASFLPIALRQPELDIPLTIRGGSLSFFQTLCGARRLVYAPDGDAPPDTARPPAFDRGAAWRLRLEASPHAGGLLIEGKLVRGSGRRERARALEEAELVLSHGVVLWPDRVARLRTGTAWPWLTELRRGSPIAVAAEDAEAFLDRHVTPSGEIELVLPATHRLERAEAVPQPWLRVNVDEATRQLHAAVELQYGARRVRVPHDAESVVDLAERKIHAYDRGFEGAALELLSGLGFKTWAPTYGVGESPNHCWRLRIAAKRLPGGIERLLREGWRVEAHGRIYRRPGRFDASVKSGKDWFELEGHVDYEGEPLGLPELLAAVRRGSNTIELGDGTVGVVPEAWLGRLGLLSGAGGRDGGEGKVRVPRAQVMLLDELVRQVAGIHVDDAYTRLSAELHRVDALEPADAPRGFEGELREYQRRGLAWMRRLEELGFGGCLADDMGLGKTVQVLALLLDRSVRKRRPSPSLIVAPSSVVHNWVDEARRFTPALRLASHAGPDRPPLETALQEADVIVTSYALLRQQAAAFAAAAFDTLVLDEAQAIKNYDTATARAARSLQASHRLTLTGTPIENHIGELGSQLELLNPGMLSASSQAGKALISGRADGETLALVRRAVRPFVLRRTKQEVAPELPDRIEKILYVDLEGKERRRYEELHAHYRARIQDEVAKLGLARSTPQVLEALLRLRQAACHPGLLDARRRREASAKLDRLLLEVDSVCSAGGKCLVFSQFTTLLSIVRERLDARGVSYEYLDGATRRRKEPISRFQGSDNIRIFLISLKAGGVGLNLTAAEHVFLLDPWWNPAVEAQAIDRTHRIGQTRNVFAYKLIARRTVEEKVLELQREKREVARAILGDDAGLGGKLTREDLEALLA